MAHTSEIFKNTNIPKVHGTYKYFLGIYLYSKIKRENFEQAGHSYNTRGRGNALVPFQRLTSSQRSLSYAAPVFWNSLLVDITEADTLSKFKIDLKNFFFVFVLMKNMYFFSL